MILENIKYGRIKHLTLIDPEKYNNDAIMEIIGRIENAGSDGILVGGSTGTDQNNVDFTVRTIKQLSKKPVILFPSHPGAVSLNADAIFFLSLLNSESLDYVIGYQVASSRMLKQTKMEAISVAYLVFEPGMTVGKVGKAKLIKRDDWETALSYADAAELIGFQAIYLEAGSGAAQNIDIRVVSKVAEDVTIPVIVGGGIRDAQTAKAIIDAGAACVVTGTIGERDPRKLEEIVKTIKN